MKSIAKKRLLWVAAVLLALGVAYLLASSSIERMLHSVDRARPAVGAAVHKKIAAVDQPPADEGSNSTAASGGLAAGVTRTFIKPSHPAWAQAVHLEISAVEQNSELVVSGSLLAASQCSRLQIDLELQADDGRKVFHTMILGSAGPVGQRPIQSRRRLPPSAAGTPALWSAHVASLRCLDP